MEMHHGQHCVCANAPCGRHLWGTTLDLDELADVGRECLNDVRLRMPSKPTVGYGCLGPPAF